MGIFIAPKSQSSSNGLDASVVITFELGACHQDVILHEGLDVQAVADLGCSGDNSVRNMDRIL